MFGKFMLAGFFTAGIALTATAPASAEWKYREGGYVDCSVFKSENRSLTSPESRDSEAERRCCEARLGQHVRPGVDALCPVSTYRQD